MRLLRRLFPTFLFVTLAACGGIASSGDDSEPDADPDGGQMWIYAPTRDASADGWTRPPSVKVPPSVDRDASVPRWDAGPPAPWTDDASAPPPGYLGCGPAFATDLSMPSLDPVCAERDANRGSHQVANVDPSIPPDARVSVTRDLTQHRDADGVYRASFSLVFRTGPYKASDPAHGRTRTEHVSEFAVYLESVVSRPNAFAVGVSEEIRVGRGVGGTTVCAEDGTSYLAPPAEWMPYQPATITLTKRDATGVAGTIVLDDGRSLPFDAPFGENDPLEDGICCLR